MTSGGTLQINNPITQFGSSASAFNVSDAIFTLQDDADSTKQAQFQIGGLTTGTTRTYTLPDASGTIPLLSLAQTFTTIQTFSGSSNVFGSGTSTGTQGFATGATTSGQTKTVNIGTGGLAGSSTPISIGPFAGAGTVAFNPGLTSITMTDAAWTLLDDADNTKKAQFQLSGLTTATTRTYTLPDVSDTLAVLGAAQVIAEFLIDVIIKLRIAMLKYFL